jgi:MFS transporter, Spinster family, sphingosine-1-phosphate transporter
MLAGLIGVPTGSALAQCLRPTHSTCDPLICAFALISSAPCVYLGLCVAPHSSALCFLFVFLAQVTLNMTWSLVADMTLVRPPPSF